MKLHALALSAALALLGQAAQAAPPYLVRGDDATAIATMQRWAAQSSWTVDVHPEVQASKPDGASPGSYGDSFESAMVRLGAASQLTRAPFRPCFYAPKTVRVIPGGAVCSEKLAHVRPEGAAIRLAMRTGDKQ